MAEVVTRLGMQAKHVLFGHTHRAGPFANDDSLEWTLPGGGAADEHRLLGLRGRCSCSAGARARTGRARSSSCDDDRPAAILEPAADRGRPGRAQGARPGVNVVAWQVTPAPTSSSSVARGRDAVLACSWCAPVYVTSWSAPLTRIVPVALQHRPDRAGLVGPAVGARVRRASARRASRTARPRGGPARRGRRSTPSSSWIARSVSRVAALAVVDLEQPVALVPEVARRPALVAVQPPDRQSGCRRRRGARSRAAATAARTTSTSLRRRVAGRMHATGRAGPWYFAAHALT